MDEQKMRKAFVAFLKPKHLGAMFWDGELNGTGPFRDLVTQVAWVAWQEAVADTAREIVDMLEQWEDARHPTDLRAAVQEIRERFGVSE